MNKTQAIMLYKDMQPFIDMMNNEQAGIILKAVYNYSCNNVEFKSDDSLLQSVFTFAKNKIDLSDDNYKKKCERNAENARKRWQKYNANACERIPEDANECLTKTKLNQTKTKLNQDNTKLKINDIGTCVNFDFIISFYPEHRRGYKNELKQYWKSNFLDGKKDEIEKGLKKWLVSDDWNKDEGKFIPSFEKFITENRYLSTPKLEEHQLSITEKSLMEVYDMFINKEQPKSEEKKYDFSGIKI